MSFFGPVQEVVFDVKGKFKTGRGYLIVGDRERARVVLQKHGSELEGQEVELDLDT
jgi:hypothetical protein